MLPVADRRLLAHVADAAVHAGADDLAIVDRQFDEVRERFGTEYDGVPVQHVDQGEATGTAGAVAAASSVLDEAFAILNGDNIYDPESIADLFDNGPAVGGTRLRTRRATASSPSTGDRVTDVVEKPAEPPTSLATLRHDDAAVRLTVKGERMSTGRRKVGVVVGDVRRPGSTPVSLPVSC